MKKKDYPGGVKLTLKTARAVAVQEFGTAKGLEKEEVAMPGYFKMKLGTCSFGFTRTPTTGRGALWFRLNWHSARGKI